MRKKNPMKLEAGCGLDVGTMNLVSARTDGAGDTVIKSVRDAFLTIDTEHKKMLKLSKVSFVETSGNLLVLGDDAVRMANLLKQEARRPLSKGVISSGEMDAQEVLSILIGKILGAPVVPGEHCYYSVPAEPIDIAGQDIVYHREVFRKILTSLGYMPHPMNEAMAIIFSQAADTNFSALSVSYGAGMVNVALAAQATSALEFSLSKSGDWVDEGAAKAVGKTATQMCSIKERGINLKKPATREQEAVVFYIRALIEMSLKAIQSQFKKVTQEISEPVPFIVSGGTSKPEGFLELFQEVFDEISKKSSFPIPISEVRAATDPLNAVAEGLLVLAAQED